MKEESLSVEHQCTRHYVTILINLGHEQSQSVGRKNIICIDKHNPVAVSSLNTMQPGLICAAILLMDNLDTRVFFRKCPCNLQCTVT